MRFPGLALACLVRLEKPLCGSKNSSMKQSIVIWPQLRLLELVLTTLHGDNRKLHVREGKFICLS